MRRIKHIVRVKEKPPIKLFLVCAILIAGGFFIYRFNAYRQTHQAVQQKSYTDTDSVLKVGSETIYGKDLAMEMASYPKLVPEAKAIILSKLQEDSIILQGASEDGLLFLDSSFYNSPDKDYQKRLTMVQTARKLVSEKGDSLEGYVVALWFRNNGYIGPSGLEKSNAEAKKKITALQKEVLAKHITIREAGDIIKNDISNKKLDLAYQNNAIFAFTTYSGKNDRVTLSPELNEALWNLSAGETSDVYLAKGVDADSGEIYDALYCFAYITDRKMIGRSYISFDDWLVAKKQVYKVEYF